MSTILLPIKPEYVAKILEQTKLLPYFNAVVSGNDVKNPKPDPEIFNLAAKKIDLEKKDLIVVEDSYCGIDSGSSALIDTCFLSDHIYPKATYNIKFILELISIVLDS